MENKYFLLLALPAFLVGIILLNFIGQDGYFGLGPISNSCVGFKVDSAWVEDNFPKRNYSYSDLIHVRYLVPDRSLGKGSKYCLGQDVKNWKKNFFEAW